MVTSRCDVVTPAEVATGEVPSSRPISFGRELLKDVWLEGVALTRANHAETGVLSAQDFDPDTKRYLTLEQQGLTRLFTMRLGSQLIGYAVFLVVPHLHYPKLLWAMQDVLYVSPDHRGPGAVKFILWTDEELKADGVQVIYRHVSERNDYSRTLLRMGYAPCERSYLKRL